MALYFLTYDLREESDYDSLYKELEAFKAIRILESTWCFRRFNTNAEELCNHFKKFIDSDDGLIVSQVTDWASIRVLQNPNDLK